MLPVVFAPREEEAELWDLGLKSESASLPHPELAAAQRSHVVACAPRPRYNAHAPDHRRLLRPGARQLLVRGLSRAAAATPHAAASPGITCSRHSSVSAAPSTSPQHAGGACDLVALTLTASAVAVSACSIFFAAIRSMLACKREAEFLEKYFDSARKKLPESMASLRLVGREVGDLAADLSDLSQEMTKGVRSSMSIVHTADAQLRQPTPFALPGTARRMYNQKKVAEEPLLASTLRDLRELIKGIRSGFGATAGMADLFMWASNFQNAVRNAHSVKVCFFNK